MELLAPCPRSVVLSARDFHTVRICGRLTKCPRMRSISTEGNTSPMIIPLHRFPNLQPILQYRRIVQDTLNHSLVWLSPPIPLNMRSQSLQPIPSSVVVVLSTLYRPRRKDLKCLGTKLFLVGNIQHVSPNIVATGMNRDIDKRKQSLLDPCRYLGWIRSIEVHQCEGEKFWSCCRSE
jgi:hypothetical protein